MIAASIQSLRALDEAAISGGVPGLALMERAGAGVAAAVLARFAGVQGRRVLVVCGKGNNAGDGFVAARLLLAGGVEAACLLLYDKEACTRDAQENLDRAGTSGVRFFDGTPGTPLPDFSVFDLLVDAIFGTGFSGEVTGPLKTCIDAMNASGRPVVSVDTPSGIDSNTGAVNGSAVRATETVTMGLPKLGQLFYPARTHVGHLLACDIGYDLRLLKKQPPPLAHWTDRALARAGIPTRPGDTHKNRCGRVLCVAGSRGLTGAAVLSAHAVLRSGAGVVTLCVPESLNIIFEIKLTEEMTLPLKDAGKGFLGTRHAKTVLKAAESYDVLLVGPGLGRSPDTRALVRTLTLKSPVPVVLDADGINAFEGKAGLLKTARSPLVLTPHEGEFLRLTRHAAVPQQGPERIRFTCEAQKALCAGLVLKGASTLVSFTPDEVYINTSGNAGMATAGAGDVLTGLLAGLFAQGRDLKSAAITAVYLHGLAGDIAARTRGVHGLIASDILERLPDAFLETLS
ncbi:MAG: NAD(P)H-hydrate dehydratase [Fibrobacterota bacterium]